MKRFHSVLAPNAKPRSTIVPQHVLMINHVHLLSCQRYIELNLVRVAMVSGPARYRWTSYRCNALGVSDGWLMAHELYRPLGSSANARQAAYRALFLSHLDNAAIDEIRLALNQNQPLGNLRF